jgi:predicted RNase H-like HicB family nuclease
MRNEFTAIVGRDGKWFIAYCPEIPGANGQGKTKKECLKNLSSAIDLILDLKGQTFNFQSGAASHLCVF